MPAVTIKFLPLKTSFLIFGMAPLMSLMAYERYHTWVKPHRVTAPATSRNPMQTFMAAIHSEETIRTNCSQVQQSRPGMIIYELDHLWVPYGRTKHRLSAFKHSHPSFKEQCTSGEVMEKNMYLFLMLSIISN